MEYLIVTLIIGSIVMLIYVTGITFTGLPVLMYHNVIESGIANDLTITIQQLEEQFRYLVEKNYTTIFLSDLLNYTGQNKALPPKPVLLSFDDGYKNNYTYLYPLLKKYNLKANIFLVAGFIKSSGNDETGTDEFLNVDEITEMGTDHVEFGLHSYDHKSYTDLAISQVEEDIVKCCARLDQLRISYQPCLAYTYGAYPKNTEKRRQIFNIMNAKGIQLAFRIGNRLNKMPLKNKFLVQRIDIRGNESFRRFKLALIAGKKIFFK